MAPMNITTASGWSLGHLGRRELAPSRRGRRARSRCRGAGRGRRRTPSGRRAAAPARVERGRQRVAGDQQRVQLPLRRSGFASRALAGASNAFRRDRRGPAGRPGPAAAVAPSRSRRRPGSCPARASRSGCGVTSAKRQLFGDPRRPACRPRATMSRPTPGFISSPARSTDAAGEEQQQERDQEDRERPRRAR